MASAFVTCPRKFHSSSFLVRHWCLERFDCLIAGFELSRVAPPDERPIVFIRFFATHSGWGSSCGNVAWAT